MGVQSYIRTSGTTMKSSANLKGQLGTRSGPLSPTSSKLTTQYLVLDHMTNHYSKITKAKPAIDNRPPKSMTTSQKARDRKAREHVVKSGSRPPSSAAVRRRPHTGLGYYDEDIYNEQLWGDVDPEDEDDKLAYEIMRTTLKGQADGYHRHESYPHPVHIPAAEGRPQRPISARSHRSVGSMTSARQLQPQAVPQKGTYSGDVLNKRAHVFTEEKPFTPRTLKTDRVSRLSQYKYYNKPPLKDTKKGEKHAPVSSHPPPQQPEEPVQSTSEARPQPKPRPRKTSTNTEGNDTLNSLTFETLRTRDLRHMQDRDQVVPPLDISLDTDQMKYIKNQGTRSNGQAAQANDTLRTTGGSVRADGTYGSSIDFGKTGEMSLTYGTLPDSKARTFGTKSSISSQRLTSEEEEAKYVDFVKAVTNDVLNRGIYTDKALCRVFEAHIKQRRGELDEFRMRNMINQIRADLGVSRTDSNDLHLHISEMDNTLESSIRDHDTRFLTNGPPDEAVSKESSTYESPGSLQFPSTDEMYSTIRSEVPNGTLSDTQALRDYQMNISKKDDISEESEGEIVVPNYGSNLPARLNKNSSGLQDRPTNGEAPHTSVITVEVEVHPAVMSSGPVSPAVETEHQPQVSSSLPPVTQGAGMGKDEGSVASRPGSSRIESTRNTDVSEGEEYGDDEYEDDYDDEEEEAERNDTTEPTATYRTDDDDF